MRRSNLNSILGMLLLASVLFGQNLSIQGVARDNSGQSLANGSYGFVFRLYTVETGGSAVWTESQTLDVLNGVFSVILGDVNSMAGIDFDAQYWLSLEIDGNGELSPRSRLVVSPYAIMASLGGQDNVVPLSGNVGIGVSAPLYKLDVSGQLALDAGEYEDVWIQGGRAVSGIDRNLALLGNKAQDRLFVNYGGEYTGGTVLGGNVGIGTSSPLFTLDIGGAIHQNHSTSYDVWIQGGTGGGNDRNLALLGEKYIDGLKINFGSEYTGGTSVDGKLGVGRYSTGARLEVEGDIKLGPNASYGAVAAEAGQTKIIYGWVSAAGGVETGAGFTVSRYDVGSYQINFTQPFAGVPAATFTNIGGGVGVDNSFWIPNINQNLVVVIVRDNGGFNEDSRFNFIVVGPR